MVWGLLGPLSEIVIVPVRLPPAVGLKVTEIVQSPSALTVVPQVLVWEKSPLAVMLVMARLAVPTLVRVTVWGALVVPTICAPSVRLVEERTTKGSAPASRILATKASAEPMSQPPQAF
jgi:hypothetical protein